MINKLKNIAKQLIVSSNLGNQTYFFLKKIAGRLPKTNPAFPNNVNIEVASLCNLNCTHCPPHADNNKHATRKYGIIDLVLYNKIMDEVDAQGPKVIALHKDGEPLLHPNIIDILERVKRNVGHYVYLTTNAHRLDDMIGNSLLKNKIDTINLSIGAASSQFYEKVRGSGFDKVIQNIEGFLALRKQYDWKPRIIVQIIDLPEYPEMKTEIVNFKKFWNERGVETMVYKKLSWGVLETKPEKIKRYPCFALWNDVNINSDGSVSACCMDWNLSLLLGNTNQKNIAAIWTDQPLQAFRKMHIDKEEHRHNLCNTCNYWATVPKLGKYYF